MPWFERWPCNKLSVSLNVHMQQDYGGRLLQAYDAPTLQLLNGYVY